MESERAFAEEFAGLDRPDEVKSSYALDMLAEISAAEGSSRGVEDAKTALDLLSTRYDPIRRNYWEYRKGLLPTVAEASSSRGMTAEASATAGA